MTAELIAVGMTGILAAAIAVMEPAAAAWRRPTAMANAGMTHSVLT